jgi:Ser/Thr protein kinase RdoA (MazF antagonist)
VHAAREPAAAARNGRGVSRSHGVNPPIEPALDAREQAAAVAILTAAWGCRVALAAAHVVWERDHVVRLVTTDGRTAILKRVRQDDTATAAEHGRAFAAEQVALELLAGTADPVAPRHLGTDTTLGLLIVEELPPGRSLAESLLGDDRAAAHADLVAYGHALATIGVHGVERAEEHRELRRRRGLPPDQPPRAVEWAARSRPEFRTAASGLGLDPSAIEPELDAVASRIAGAYAGFVHGDPCPDNVRLVDGRCRIFDFERAGAGSIALDAAHLVVPFPTCWCFARLPLGGAAPALDAHRDVLARHGLDAGIAWDRALVDASATWLLARTSLLTEALGSDRTWGTTSLRARWLVWTATFPSHAERVDALPRTARFVWQLHSALRRRWSDVVLPGYPALQEAGDAVVVAPDGWADSP